MSVKERLIEYLKYEEISKSEFGRTIGVSNAYISSMRKSIQPDKIQSISLNYPNLNTEWLLTGEGEMLKQNSTKTEISKENINMKTVENLSEVNLKLTNEIIEIRSENKELIEKIKLLEEELRQLGKDQYGKMAL